MRKITLKIVLFFAIFLVGGYSINSLVENKVLKTSSSVSQWVNKYYYSSRWDGFYDLPKDSLDVVFLGASPIHCGINPVEIYDGYGITSYDISADQQDIGTSYFFLKEVFKTQSPQAVVIDIGSMVPEKISEVSAHYSFDYMKLSLTKIQAVMDRCEKSDWLELIFPFIQYHTRWKEIGEDDFEFLGHDTYNPLMGFWGYAVVTPGEHPVFSEEVKNVFLDMQTEELLFGYLERIQELCEENETQLIFLKMPYTNAYSINYPMINSVEKYCSQAEIPFINYIYNDQELDLDYATDFTDVAHLNFRGAEKLSRSLGKSLTEYIAVKEKSETVKQYWEKGQEAYEYAYAISSLIIEPSTSAENYDTYINTILENKNLTAFLIGFGSNASTLNFREFQSDENGIWNYVGIIDDGQWKYQNSSFEPIEEQYMVGEEVFSLKSDMASGSAYAIKNGSSLGNCSRGINVFVYDKESEQIVDYKVFDIYQYINE